MISDEDVPWHDEVGAWSLLNTTILIADFDAWMAASELIADDLRKHNVRPDN